jgi:hypothetical protein
VCYNQKTARHISKTVYLYSMISNLNNMLSLSDIAISAHVIYFCSSCSSVHFPIIPLVLYPTTNLKYFKFFISFLTAHNWCNREWCRVNTFYIIKYGFVLYPTNVVLLHPTLRLHTFTTLQKTRKRQNCANCLCRRQ